MADLTYKHLIVGLGEVGSSLFRVLEGLDTQGIDRELETEPWPEYDFLHICFPYSEKFEDAVDSYRKMWLKPDGIVVIHSTVPIGTSRRISAVHSPIHGIHPELSQSIKTFVKYIGAERREDAEKVLREFQKVGIRGLIVKNPETSELSKLGCTRRHGLMIAEEKEFYKDCEKYGADFEEAYTMWNRFYGIGYEELGRPYIRRAIVKHMPGKIGGHCIISNLEFLPGPVSDFIKERNKVF